MPKQKQRATKLSQKVVENERVQLGLATLLTGSHQAAETKWTTQGRAKYWALKLVDPTFHPTKHGGWRNGTFAADEMPFVHQIILEFLKENPKAQKKDVKSHLEFVFSRNISNSALARATQSLGWSWKIPTTFQIQVHYLKFGTILTLSRSHSNNSLVKIKIR
jgi:hypothetical protein